MKRTLACLLAIAMCLGLTACTPATTEGSNPPGTTPPVTGTPAGGKTTMKAGVYTAKANGMNGNMTVETALSEDAILSVTVTSHQETPGIGGDLTDDAGKILTLGGEAPVSLMPKEIVAMQSVKVDTVAGATITSYAITGAVKDCLAQAGANLDDWQTASAAIAPVADASADVIVVGGGGAGLAAAISASQAGASVIVVEKNGQVGGDTLVCGAIYNNPDPDLQGRVTMTDAVKATIEKALTETPVSDEHGALQAEVQKQWAAYKAEGRTDLFDSQEWFALQTWINGDKVGKLDLVKTLAYNATAGYDWIRSLGMSFKDEIGQGAGSLWQRTHTSTRDMGTGFISTYIGQIANTDKIQVLLSTTATALLQDASGAVTGVTVKDKAGNTATLTAGKGVVLSTGGFAANGKMIGEYNTSGKWSDLSKVPTTNRFSCSQGDGIAMAKEIGASLTDMDQLQLLYLGNTKDGGLTKNPPRCINGTDQEIFINKNGERFVREDGRRDEICLAVFEQPESMFYFLESADGNFTDIATAKTSDGFSFTEMEAQGYIVVAQDLDEMATKLGCDIATLKATVDAFNASVDSGKDTFGRTLYSTKLEKGPWVATPRQACLHHTMGGVTIDTESRVLDESGKVIPGLVAAGEITGGIHGGNRLGGNAVVDTVVFGKLAGETATK